MPLVFCRLNQSHDPINWIIADEIMGFERIASLLLDCAHTDDVVGARRLLERVKEQDRKSIVAKRKNCNAPLFVAALRRNVDMVECLVKEWQADMEVSGRYMDHRDGSSISVTPLWLAVVSNDMKMVELLIDLGADINAVSDTGDTLVSQACFLKIVCIVKILSMRGADVEKPNRFGETCLILAAERSLELCQILIDYGANVNAQNSLSGNTALHCAIINTDNPDKEEIVKLLIDHGFLIHTYKINAATMSLKRQVFYAKSQFWKSCCSGSNIRRNTISSLTNCWEQVMPAGFQLTSRRHCPVGKKLWKRERHMLGSMFTPRN